MQGKVRGGGGSKAILPAHVAPENGAPLRWTDADLSAPCPCLSIAFLVSLHILHSTLHSLFPDAALLARMPRCSGGGRGRGCSWKRDHIASSTVGLVHSGFMQRGPLLPALKSSLPPVTVASGADLACIW